MGPSSTLLSTHQSYMPFYGLHGPFICGGADYYGCSSRHNWSLAWRLPSHALCGGCQPAGRWGKVPEWLGTRPESAWAGAGP